jgi:hypothetical protein
MSDMAPYRVRALSRASAFTCECFRVRVLCAALRLVSVDLRGRLVHADPTWTSAAWSNFFFLQYSLGPGARGFADSREEIAHETTVVLTLSGDGRTPSSCKSGDIKRTILKKGPRAGGFAGSEQQQPPARAIVIVRRGLVV